MAQTMALVFALVATWGSFAHACHGPLPGAAHEIAVHHAHDEGGRVASHDEHVPTPGHPSHKGTQPCCADLQCHGGVAIVTTGLATVAPHSVIESFIISDQTHEDWHLAGLDRPPRSFVQA
jgi:hypothetical protein